MEDLRKRFLIKFRLRSNPREHSCRCKCLTPQGNLIRLFQRFLLLAVEASVLLAGLIFYVALTFLLAVFFGPPPGGVAEAVLFVCFLLTLAALMLFRRKTRTWKIDYDATNYRRAKAERKLHP